MAIQTLPPRGRSFIHPSSRDEGTDDADNGGTRLTFHRQNSKEILRPDETAHTAHASPVSLMEARHRSICAPTSDDVSPADRSVPVRIEGHQYMMSTTFYTPSLFLQTRPSADLCYDRPFGEINATVHFNSLQGKACHVTRKPNTLQ